MGQQKCSGAVTALAERPVPSPRDHITALGLRQFLSGAFCYSGAVARVRVQRVQKHKSLSLKTGEQEMQNARRER